MSPDPANKSGGRSGSPRLTDAVLEQTVRAIRLSGSTSGAATQLGVCRKTVYWRVRQAKLRGIGLGAQTPGTGTGTGTGPVDHPCLHFRPDCSRCWMERAFFLLVRTRYKVQDTLLLHDIEECLLRWPEPVTDLVTAPGDPPDPAVVLVLGTLSPGPGSEKAAIVNGKNTATHADPERALRVSCGLGTVGV